MKKPLATWTVCGILVTLLLTSTAIAHGSRTNDISPDFALQAELFHKLAPENEITEMPREVTLSWASFDGATSYEYCLDTTNDDKCEKNKWVDVGDQTSVALAELDYETEYFWQVRARNNGPPIYADSEMWWSFTTVGQIKLYLPAIFHRTCGGYNLPFETEPNDFDFEANGLICFGQLYQGEVTDQEDWFTIEWSGKGTIIVDVTGFTPVGQLLLYYELPDSLVRQFDQDDGHYRITYSDPSAAAGIYYIRLFAQEIGGETYSLTVRQQ